MKDYKDYKDQIEKETKILIPVVLMLITAGTWAIAIVSQF